MALAAGRWLLVLARCLVLRVHFPLDWLDIRSGQLLILNLPRCAVPCFATLEVCCVCCGVSLVTCQSCRLRFYIVLMCGPCASSEDERIDRSPTNLKAYIPYRQ